MSLTLTTSLLRTVIDLTGDPPASGRRTVPQQLPPPPPPSAARSEEPPRKRRRVEDARPRKLKDCITAHVLPAVSRELTKVSHTKYRVNDIAADVRKSTGNVTEWAPANTSYRSLLLLLGHHAFADGSTRLGGT